MKSANNSGIEKPTIGQARKNSNSNSKKVIPVLDMKKLSIKQIQGMITSTSLSSLIGNRKVAAVNQREQGPPKQEGRFELDTQASVRVLARRVNALQKSDSKDNQGLWKGLVLLKEQTDAEQKA